MSENSGDLTASEENNIVGPDFFGFYRNEVSEFLSQDDLLPSPHQTSALAGNICKSSREKGSTKSSCRTKDNNGVIGSASLFSNGIGALLTESKKERLKSLLRQSVFTLTHEVDEMIDPILSICRIRSCLRCKESILSLDASTRKADEPEPPHKKLKVLPACSDGPIMNSDTMATAKSTEIDDDLRFLLENDSTKVEELMKKHCGELSDTLHHMEQNLDELLNIIMTTCRPMTAAEKQQLRRLIQNLPPRNLDYVVEIIGHNKLSEKSSCDEVHVDLDKEDNVTLWRLYFYVTAYELSQSEVGK
ncbi:uncharacterized protein LOC105179875 isoform X2 [Sesamum indicum]|uniref:Uncharacterized protein LOC105179875 isoform X2 n=1 Tax=Sesamum indicum TaxID=4182 RepID=A0A6I9UMQ5_SESIN|nr:uncharacterized protein LOC105179875 isoform X2 [Sesamum indicum]